MKMIYLITLAIFGLLLFSGNVKAWTIPDTPLENFIYNTTNGSIKYSPLNETWLTYDGINDYVNITDNNLTSTATTGQLTISYWVNPSTFEYTGVSQGYVNYVNKNMFGPTNAEWLFRQYNATAFDSTNRSKRTSFYVFNISGGIGIGSYFQDNLTTGQWMHVVGVVNGTHTQIWRDGVLRDSDSYIGQIYPVNGNSSVKIGTDLGSGFPYYNGSIDEFRIYNRSLTQAEIRQINSSGRIANTSIVISGLVLWQSFNENNGTRSHDKANVDAINGTLLNGVRWNSTNISVDTLGYQVNISVNSINNAKVYWDNGTVISNLLTGNSIFTFTSNQTLHFLENLGTSISNCTTISTAGVYQLNQSVNYANGYSTNTQCIRISNNNIWLSLSGYSVTGNQTSYGIYAVGEKRNLSIYNGYVYNHTTGIRIESSNDSSIYDITSNNNSDKGIWIFGTSASPSKNWNISNIIAKGNANVGVSLSETHNSTIYNASVSDSSDTNTDVGIYLYNSANNTVLASNAYNTSNGIYIESSGTNQKANGNNILHNIVNLSAFNAFGFGNGITIDNASYNIVRYNNISNSNNGIRFTIDSDGNNISNNLIQLVNRSISFTAYGRRVNYISNGSNLNGRIVDIIFARDTFAIGNFTFNNTDFSSVEVRNQTNEIQFYNVSGNRNLGIYNANRINLTFLSNGQGIVINTTTRTDNVFTILTTPLKIRNGVINGSIINDRNITWGVGSYATIQ